MKHMERRGLNGQTVKVVAHRNVTSVVIWKKESGSVCKEQRVDAQLTKLSS
jgi:hypothetical protein